MRVLIDSYRNLTAEHCGSGSMRNLIYHYCGLELDEAVVFGLGSGLDCMYVPTPGLEPPYLFVGRGSSFEADLGTALDLDYTEQFEADDDRAWEAVAAEVAKGRPTMLSGDIFYLDYRDFTVHFPGHRFVLLGFDDERGEVYVADRTDEATQTCSMEALRLSRNAPVGLSGNNLWGRFNSGRVGHSLEQACTIALTRTTTRMLGGEISSEGALPLSGMNGAVAGLDGIKALSCAMAEWPTGPGALPYARNLENNIVKFGTGGALFRNLFCGFMKWSVVQRPDVVDAGMVDRAMESARLWDQLAALMKAVNDTVGDGDCWSGARDLLPTIYDCESCLFTSLDQRLRTTGDIAAA